MKRSVQRITGAVAVVVSMSGFAQDRQNTDPADPAAASAPLRYQSAFSGYQPMQFSKEAPDKTWAAANAQVSGAGDDAMADMGHDSMAGMKMPMGEMNHDSTDSMKMPPPADQAQQQPADAASMSEGEVLKVDRNAGKMTIRHGPLRNLGMPGMTMVFHVKEPSMIDRVKSGDKIRFVAGQINGALTVMTLQPVAR